MYIHVLLGRYAQIRREIWLTQISRRTPHPRLPGEFWAFPGGSNLPRKPENLIASPLIPGPDRVINSESNGVISPGEKSENTPGAGEVYHK